MTDAKQLDIISYPEPSLKQVCEPVTEFDSNLAALLDDMRFTSIHFKGLGLSAPQVGRNIRAFIVKDGENWIEMINPKVEASGAKKSYQEGCLSIPGYFEFIERRSEVNVSYQDRSGTVCSLKANDALAVEIQHENDHLDGILMVDRMSRLKREIFNKWLTKKQKAFMTYAKAIMQEQMNKPRPPKPPVNPVSTVVQAPTLELKATETVDGDSKSVKVEVPTLTLAAGQ